ncbi:hypothetical protein [Pricia sp.]|uniref:hypothetical protein n=1 Tax=Pricia sp. TaxID=2268138 RepID=UPI003593DD43
MERGTETPEGGLPKVTKGKGVGIATRMVEEGFGIQVSSLKNQEDGFIFLSTV